MRGSLGGGAGQAGAGFVLADQRQQIAHVRAVVHAGERLTQGQEQRAALANRRLLERGGERRPQSEPDRPWVVKTLDAD